MTFLVRLITFDGNGRYTVSFKAANGDEISLLTNNWQHGFEIGKEVDFPVLPVPTPKAVKVPKVPKKSPKSKKGKK
jgi:hypothetical protein